ncbi:MAG: PAS domain S-box protein, partial [Halobacterium sp.]
MSERGRRNETDRPEGATVARREFDALADVVDGGVVRVDADGRVADATDAFATLTGRERADVVGGEFAAVFADPSAREVENAHRQLRDRIATSQGSLTSGDSDAERTAELTVHVETQPGERRTRELTLRAVAANGDPQGAVGVLRERSEETAVLAEREHVLRDVYNVCADASLSFEERVGELLATVRETVGTRYATLSRVDGDDYQFRVVDTESESDAAVEAGDTTELDQTNCERVVETEQTVVFRDIDEQAPELAARDGNRELGVSCYLGAPVVVDGEVRGTFCFYGDEAREDGFSAWEVTLVDLAAQWVEYELSHRETHERLERQAEELREAEQRYRTLVENFPNGAVALVNHDLEYTTAGGTPVDSALDSTDGLVGKTVHEAVSDDLADAIAPKYRAALDGERATFVHDNGDRVARIYTFPVRDDDGDVTAAMGMSQDVTEQKERERRLAEYEAIVETVNDGIYVVDEQGCYETVNDAFCDLTGYSRRELLGEHARLVVDGETMERAAAIREQSDVERPQLETTVETADGDEVPVEVAFSSLETDGETKRVGVVRDVTERHERRRKLAESEERYRALVEHFPNGAVGLFDDELEYTAVGGEMLSDLDVSPDERVGRSVHDIYPERVATQVEPHFRAALDGEQRSFEVQYDGRVVSAQTLPVRDADGDVDAGMLVVQDVTEQREQRRQLAESEQRYRALVENLPNGGVGVFDDDLRYTLVDGTMW